VGPFFTKIAKPFIEAAQGIKIYDLRATENKNIALDDRTFKNYCIFGYMTWEQEIQIAAAEAAEAAAEKERERNEKIIAEKDAEIAALKLKLAEKSK